MTFVFMLLTLLDSYRHFCSRVLCFYSVYRFLLFRLLLAALHYNEKSDRLQAVTKEGKPCYSIRFPKHKKGEYSVRKEKTAATCGNYYDVKCMQSKVQGKKNIHPFFLAGYTKTLLNFLVREYEEDQTSLKNSIQDLR